MLIVAIFGCEKADDQTPEKILQLSSAKVGTILLDIQIEVIDVPIDQPIVLSFNASVSEEVITQAVTLMDSDDRQIDYVASLLDNGMTASLDPVDDLEYGTAYELKIDGFTSTEGAVFEGGLQYTFKTRAGQLLLVNVTIDDKEIIDQSRIQNVERQPVIEMKFSAPVLADPEHFKVSRGSLTFPATLSTTNGDSVVNMVLDQELDGWTRYSLSVSSTLTNSQGFEFEGFTNDFYTKLDSSLKFPEISDEALLTRIQEQTFKYFWDFGHPVSGMARERNTSDRVVTTGGSGFGVMAILVGIERGFISREAGVERLTKIVDFLSTCDRFHGVWPHWIDGSTGRTIPFSSDDDGGDLVETAFMIQGLITARQFLNKEDEEELTLITRINTLWQEVEWSWYQQNDQNALYWHWSPNFGWQKNLRISGWNESLIVYVLAAASPTFPIDQEVYTEGWARNGGMLNGEQFYEIELPLGPDRGGPLFFAHYSFLGLDPRNLEDQYGNYWQQNVNHATINHAYCKVNPMGFVGYDERCWGLTASDNHQGYSAHSPTNDLGVITPTAAISSLPYTPDESMAAIRHFYYILGDKLWGEYGFYDAFNVTQSWFADSYLAIDQGPIICMIENHQTSLLWDLFMSAPEVQAGLNKLDFTY